MSLTKVKKRQSDKFASFKGKRKLSEKEINLMKTRLNRGDISRNQMADNGYGLMNIQRDKGVAWLRKNHSKLRYRELIALGASTDKTQEIVRGPRRKPKWGSMNKTRMKLIDWYPQYDIQTKKVIFNYPVYEIRGHGNSFQYYVKGGEINLVG